MPEALFHGFWSQEGQAGCTRSQALSRVFLPVSIPSHRLDLKEEFREKVLVAPVGVSWRVLKSNGGYDENGQDA